MKSSARIAALIAALLPMVFVPATRAQTDPAVACAALADQRLPNTTITAAQAITSGSFTPPGATNAITNLPPFCRVAGVIAPTSESQIRFEVWLPLEKWNGKFAGVGNGGWAGNISFGALADQIRRGYASASTNTGHEAAPGVNAARFAFEHPEQLIDFAYRAHHETAVKAKALAQAFYGKPPEHSYWIGCSSGGYEGLDGGAAIPGRLRRHRRRHAGEQLDAADGGRPRRHPGGLQGFGQQPSALRAGRCSIARRSRPVTVTDGVVDGVLEDPRRCKFDPAALQCAAESGARACLTPPQVEAARRVYRGLKDPDHRRAAVSGSRARKRAVLAQPRPRQPVPDSDRALQVARLRRSELGLEDVRFTDPAGLPGLPQRLNPSSLRFSTRPIRTCGSSGSAAASCSSITAGTTS